MQHQRERFPVRRNVLDRDFKRLLRFRREREVQRFERGESPARNACSPAPHNVGIVVEHDEERIADSARDFSR